MKDQHDVIPGFTAVAPTVWEYNPTTTNPQSSKPQDGSPDLVILFSWTGANGRHVLKYTQHYQTLFPSTRILVITTSIKDLCFRSSPKKQSRLLPAVDRIIAYNSKSILIHLFSEGGSNKAVELAETYLHTTTDRLPCTALCLDSTPGHPRFLRLCNALKKSLPPHPILRCSGLAIGAVVLGAAWITYGIFKGPTNNIISKTRRRLVDDRIWDLEAPRCYLYSRADGLIYWKDVKDHARESREMGIQVQDVCFEGSAHCKHSTEDADLYWDAVVLTWQRAQFRECTEGLMESENEKGIEVEVEVVAVCDEVMGKEVGVARSVRSTADSECTLFV